MIGKLILLVLLAVLASGAWMLRGFIPGPWQQDRVVTEVSEEAAASADRKLERLRTEGDTVRLSGAEFTSYIRFRMAERFSTGDVELPSVSFEGETVRVDGRLPRDRIPERDLRRLGPGADFVPDTANVGVSGRMRMLAPGRAALRVEGVRFETLPIPRERFLPILNRVRGMDEPGLEPDELAFQLPRGVGAARVEDGMLVLAPDAR
ncbi:MAG TPA: hypothetical protein VHG93_03275 [Longimicrobium sp.]|nr:hypothetical protein [Longimicrobium sp.]